MTRLTKPVRRVTRPYRVLKSKPAPIVVTLLPSDEIELRHLYQRDSVRVSLAEIFRKAVMQPTLPL
jgi:hypothetical protein